MYLYKYENNATWRAGRTLTYVGLYISCRLKDLVVYKCDKAYEIAEKAVKKANSKRENKKTDKDGVEDDE